MVLRDAWPMQVFARGQDEEQRGLTPGFLEGPQHQRLVRGRAPRHRGVLAGRVTHVDARSGTVTIDMQVCTTFSTVSHLASERYRDLREQLVEPPGALPASPQTVGVQITHKEIDGASNL